MTDFDQRDYESLLAAISGLETESAAGFPQVETKPGPAAGELVPIH